MAALSRSMTGRGVAAGARRPSQELELVAGHGVGDRRQPGKHGRALGGADRDRLELAVADLAEHRGRVLELHLDAARDEVDQRRPGAAIWNVRDVDAGERLEQFGGQEIERADAGRAVADRARLRARERDQVAHRFDREILVDDEHRRAGGDLHDRREVAQQVVGHVLLDVRVDRDRRRRAQDGVAVRRRLGGLPGADRAAGAADVLDHDRALELLRRAPGRRCATSVSVPPPAANGTISRIGRDG